MHKYSKYIFTLVFSIIFLPSLASASTYGWSESLGYFDFTDITVTDSAITGYAYNDNTGFLNMTGVTNDGTGILSGYAWSESVGYFDFSEVVISNGTFDGYAYNDNTGFLNMTGVTTSWAPAVPEQDDNNRGSRSGGCSVVCKYNNLIKQGKTTEAEELKQKYPKAFPVFNQNTAPTNPVSPANTTLNTTNRDLQLGTAGEDVRALQKLLNSLGYIVNPTVGGPGSVGNETSIFGPLTQQALIRFQKENNITPSLGYFGPITKAYMKLKGYIN